MSLANFVGSVNFTNMTTQTVVVQPSSNPAPVFYGADNVNVINVTEYTAIFGPTYETSYYVEDAYGPVADAPQSRAMRNVKMAGMAFVVLLVLFAILHGPKIYWFLQYRQISRTAKKTV